MNNLALSALAGWGSGSSVVTPEGTEFDGVTDYLSRSSDLVGNVDSKTFTFSCWVYIDPKSLSVNTTAILKANTGLFSINIKRNSNSAGYINLDLKDYSNNSVVSANSAVGVFSFNGWHNLLISIDTSNSSKRYVYLDDGLINMTWNTYSTSLQFAFNANFFILPSDTTRISSVLFDRNYRDLSIEANRRLFITADGKPTPTATLKALNPILYLPMKDAATCHINEGTGGNFVQNGTLDTASRGANQDNCVASYLLSDADYLYKSGTFAFSKQLTYSCTFKKGQSYGTLFYGANVGETRNTLSFDFGLDYISLQLVNSSNQYILKAIVSNIILLATNTLTLSLDLASTALRKVFLNGVDITSSVTWTTYNTASSAENISRFTINGYGLGAGLMSVYMGELYFDTKYIDLATSNPFWDADTNRPKPVSQVIAETGITPLIAMPLDASNAGKNYGTGGDFTANSAPYVGARGGSEFWARSAKLGTEDYHTNAIYLPKTFTTQTLTMVVFFTEYDKARIFSANAQNSPVMENFIGESGSNDNITVQFKNSIGTNVFYAYNQGTLLTGGLFNSLLISIDLTASGRSKIYLNNTLISTSIETVGQYISFSHNLVFGNGDRNANDFYLGMPVSISTPYFTTDYIDFSQEVNRNKFIDQLGYPKDLKAQIEAGVIPKPLIYLPFDDTSNLGKNLGTGGDFTVNGTVKAGADFSL